MDKINLKYKIVERHDEHHSIVVRYWSDIVAEEDVRFSSESLPDGSPVRCKTDLNIVITENINTEEELEKFIINHAPIHELKQEERKKTSNTTVIMSVVNSFMDKTHEKEIDLTPPPPPTNIEETPELTDDQIEDILNQITLNSSNDPNSNKK